MVKKISLKARKRFEKIDKTKVLKKMGDLPAVVYGQGEQAQSLKINVNEFVKAYKIAGESSLIDLSIDDSESLKVIIKEIQKDAVRNNIVHVDFYKVNMKERIEVEIPLHFIGESKAEKELGGILVRNHESITVKCLPGDLLDHIDIDLTVLKSLNDAIRAVDVKLPENIQLSIDSNEVVVNVIQPQLLVEEPISNETKIAGSNAAEAAANGKETGKKE